MSTRMESEITGAARRARRRRSARSPGGGLIARQRPDQTKSLIGWVVGSQEEGWTGLLKCSPLFRRGGAQMYTKPESAHPMKACLMAPGTLAPSVE